MDKPLKQILIVEDETLIALDIASALESFGYEVCATVDSGEKAVASALQLLPDLILMDITLKGKMDGIEAAHAIMSQQLVPIVFLTADEEEGTLQKAKLSLPYGYLLKPFDLRELRSNIEIALQRIDSLRAAGIDSQSRSIGDPEHEVENELSISKDLTTLIAKLPLFQDLPHQVCEQFATQVRERRLDGGEYLVNEGNDPNGGFIVISGRISITKTSVAGKELIVASLAPGDTFGLLYTLQSFSQSSAARCQVTSRILWVATAAFENLQSANPQLARRFTDQLSHDLAISHQLSSSLAHSSVEGRIIAALITLLARFAKSGAAVNQGRIFMTRRELADLVGTTPETAIRITKMLERDGLLDLSRPGIIKILDVQRLRSVDPLR